MARGPSLLVTCTVVKCILWSVSLQNMGIDSIELCEVEKDLRYRKKKINIEDVLILHNTNIRRQLNPVKTKDFHMKCSIDRKDKLFGLKRNLKQNCFNKSETFRMKRENLMNFEKPGANKGTGSDMNVKETGSGRNFDDKKFRDLIREEQMK